MKTGGGGQCPCGSGKEHEQCCGAVLGASADEQALQEHLAAYAAPLVEGIPEGASERLVDGVLKTAAVCWTLALLKSDAERDAAIRIIVEHSAGTDEERRDRERLIRSMIARHREMFPEMH